MLNLAGISELAVCHSEQVGYGTTIHPFAVVTEEAVIGDDCQICSHVFVEGVIGNRCTVKNGAQVYRGVTIGDDCFIGPNVVFCNDKYPISPRSEAGLTRYANKDGHGCLMPVSVGRGAQIGACSVILPGVMIGQWAFVAAGSVVTKDVPDGGYWLVKRPGLE